MPDVSRAHFRFDIPAPPEPELIAYARKLFMDFDRAAEEKLPFPDYDLAVYVEEGSLKGGGKVMVAAATLYFGIGQFGSFVQGVREISVLGKAVASQVIMAARRDPLTEGVSIGRTRRDAGTVRRIERLLERVAEHEIDPEEAARQVLELLDREDDPLPSAAQEDILEAFRSLELNPKQLLLPLDVEEVPEPESVPSTPRERPLPPTRRFLVEIRREGKEGEQEVKTRYR